MPILTYAFACIGGILIGKGTAIDSIILTLIGGMHCFISGLIAGYFKDSSK